MKIVVCKTFYIYIFEFITNLKLYYDIIRAESYIVFSDWIASKKATVNPKNEKDNECFKLSIIAGLSYNKIKEKELKKLLKFRRTDIDFSLYQRDWKKI